MTSGLRDRFRALVGHDEAAQHCRSPRLAEKGGRDAQVRVHVALLHAWRRAHVGKCKQVGVDSARSERTQPNTPFWLYSEYCPALTCTECGSVGIGACAGDKTAYSALRTRRELAHVLAVRLCFFTPESEIERLQDSPRRTPRSNKQAMNSKPSRAGAGSRDAGTGTPHQSSTKASSAKPSSASSATGAAQTSNQEPKETLSHSASTQAWARTMTASAQTQINRRPG